MRFLSLDHFALLIFLVCPIVIFVVIIYNFFEYLIVILITFESGNKVQSLLSNCLDALLAGDTLLIFKRFSQAKPISCSLCLEQSLIIKRKLRLYICAGIELDSEIKISEK